jgi:hypothetical protein
MASAHFEVADLAEIMFEKAMMVFLGVLDCVSAVFNAAAF